MTKMLDTNLFFGFGVTDMRVFDSGFFEIILGTGVVGLMLYILFLLYILFIALNEFFKKNINGVFLLCNVVSILGVSLGGSAIHLNRSSSLLIIVLICLILLIHYDNKKLLKG
jgi:hypothetical protein